MAYVNVFWSMFLGAIQGLTEFFPVSSSGHLVLLPYLFNIKSQELSFDIALHAGTLLAIFWVFRQKWLELFEGIIKRDHQSLKLFAYLFATSLPTALAGYFFKDLAETTFRLPLLVALNLIIWGIILFGVDKRFPQKKQIYQLNIGGAFVVGLAQAAAILPGVSRSGITITAARILGLKRSEALEYSFMAAAPIILGAAIFGLKEASPQALFSPSWLWGFLSALLASAFAIKFLTTFVKKRDFGLFLWWRIALASAIIILLIRGH